MTETTLMIPEKPLLIKERLSKKLENLDSQSLLIIGGMLCFTIIACVCFVSLSGNEMIINSSGFAIKHFEKT